MNHRLTLRGALFCFVFGCLLGWLLDLIVR